VTEQQLEDSQWPVTAGSRGGGGVPVLSRVAHDRAHTARSLPDPAQGRPVRLLTVTADGTPGRALAERLLRSHGRALSGRAARHGRALRLASPQRGRRHRPGARPVPPAR
jgi:hypothetical protein